MILRDNSPPSARAYTVLFILSRTYRGITHVVLILLLYIYINMHVEALLSDIIYMVGILYIVVAKQLHCTHTHCWTRIGKPLPAIIIFTTRNYWWITIIFCPVIILWLLLVYLIDRTPRIHRHRYLFTYPSMHVRPKMCLSLYLIISLHPITKRISVIVHIIIILPTTFFYKI